MSTPENAIKKANFKYKKLTVCKSRLSVTAAVNRSTAFGQNNEWQYKKYGYRTW